MASAGFQARLDEMLRSRELQLKHLNEEIEVQRGKRVLLEERRSVWRRIRLQILVLKRSLCHIDLQRALEEEELRKRKTRTEELGREQRHLASEISVLEQRQVQDNYDKPRKAAELARQQEALELETVLKTLELNLKAATRNEQELMACRDAVAAEIERNLWNKSQVENQIKASRQLENQVKQQQEDIKALELDNESLENELLEVMMQL